MRDVTFCFARPPSQPSGRGTIARGVLTHLRRELLGLSSIVVLLLAGCGIFHREARERQFREHFPYQDLNRSLSLSTIEGLTETTIGRLIELELVNESDHTVAFSPKEGIVGLVYDAKTNQWVQVENAVRYPDGVEGLWPRGGSLPNMTVVGYQPILEDRVDSISIRVLAIGHVWEEDQGLGEPVAAYVDLTLRR